MKDIVFNYLKEHKPEEYINLEGFPLSEKARMISWAWWHPFILTRDNSAKLVMKRVLSEEDIYAFGKWILENQKP